MAENPEQQCIFCKIAKGEIQSFVIYSDDKCIAVLDINPATKGHLLLIPKEHHALMPMIPEELAAHLGQVSKYLALKAIDVFAAKDANIFTAAGAAAGQNAPHVIVHIIPRYDNDEVSMDLPGNKISSQELEKIRNALIPKIEKEFGVKIEGEEKAPKKEMKTKMQEEAEMDDEVGGKPQKPDDFRDDEVGGRPSKPDEFRDDEVGGPPQKPDKFRDDEVGDYPRKKNSENHGSKKPDLDTITDFLTGK